MPDSQNHQPSLHQGSCLCGGISYTVDQELSDFGYCHCQSCRKASGSAHAANAGVAREKFHLSDPHTHLREYQSSPGKFRAFCSQCGSPLYAYLGDSPQLIRVRLGSLDSQFTKTAQAHTFVADKASWEAIDAGLPQYPEWAPREVLQQVGSRQP